MNENKLTNNHRTVYQTYNSSKIFELPLNENLNTYEKSNSRKKIFPNYKQETSYNRRIKEFFGDIGTLSTRVTSKGFLSNEIYNKKNDSSSARKILDKNAITTIEEINSLKKIVPIFTKNSVTFKQSLNKSARDIKISQNQSNIFHLEVYYFKIE